MGCSLHWWFAAFSFFLDSFHVSFSRAVSCLAGLMNGAVPRTHRLCLQSLRIPLLINYRTHAGVMLTQAWRGSICNMYLYVWHRLIINEPTWFERYYPRHLVDEDICLHYWGVSWEDHSAHVSGKGMEINLSIDGFRFIKHEQPVIERKPISCDWLAHYFQSDSECWYPQGHYAEESH